MGVARASRVYRASGRYADFVFFLLAEEDKQSASAIQYWVHVLDCDGDGVIDTSDMRFFFEEQERCTPDARQMCMPNVLCGKRPTWKLAKLKLEY